jgi:hypothetical protein
MSMITDVWQQLVQRRLWPLAVLLLAALVAVPVLLSKDPAPAPVPTSNLPAVSAKTDNATAEPVVALADEGAARRRRVLGARKDPFAPAPMPKVKAAATPVAAGTAPALGGSTAGGTSAPGGSSSPVLGPTYPTTGGTPPKKKKTYPGDSLTVRFGTGQTSDPKTVLEADQGLPVDATDVQQPLLVYLGLAKGGKEALFLVDASVIADGDGHCDGDSATDCQTLHLRAGDTEFLDVTDDKGDVVFKYQLDLIAIHPSKQTLAAAAKAAKAAKAKAAKRHHAKGAKAVTAAVASAAGAASAGGSAQLGAGVGALLRSL